jgi:hypothetical protein
MYGAITLLLSLCIGIGTWTVLRIIDFEVRIGYLEKSIITKEAYHDMDKRLDRMERDRANNITVNMPQKVN